MIKHEHQPTHQLIEKALDISLKAHAGQTDKAGAVYVLHPLRIMMQMDSPEEKIIAALHDVLEDSHFTAEFLRQQGFPENILSVLDILSRKPGVKYEDYIQRIKQNPTATKIKIADLKDNMDISRLKDITEKDLKRLKKYQSAFKILTQ